MFGKKPKKIKSKKILFMAAVGSHNLGDELILKGEVEYIQKHYGKNIEITAFTYDPTSTIIRGDQVKFVSYFPNDIRHKPFHNIWYLFHNIWLIARSDVLIIGGGGIIFDNEPGVSFLGLFMQWSLRIRIARFFKTTLLFWGIGLEVTQAKNRMKLRKLFMPGDFILVRDPRSKGLLDAIEIPSVEVQDIVFLYTPPLLAKPISPIKLVGISMRGGFLEKHESVIPQIHDYLMDHGYKPIFLVFSTNGEEEQNDTLFIRKVMLGKTYNTTKNITQTLDVYPFLYAVIGMRLHAGILACVHEIPYIPVSYGPKTEELINMFNIEHLAMNVADINLELFISRWNMFIRDYDIEKHKMGEVHIILRDALIEKLKNI